MKFVSVVRLLMAFTTPSRSEVMFSLEEVEWKRRLTQARLLRTYFVRKKLFGY